MVDVIVRQLETSDSIQNAYKFLKAGNIGNFFASENNKVVQKVILPDGSVSSVSGGSSIDIAMMQRPVSDSALFPQIEASNHPDFTNPIYLEPRISAQDRTYFQVYTGTEWIAFPDDGLGTPFDGKAVAFNVSKFNQLPQPFYMRYYWVDSNGTESNYRSIIFPSVQTLPPAQSSEDGSLINEMLLVRPAADMALFPKIEASTFADFSNVYKLDPANDDADLASFKVYDGNEWIDMPSDGLGTPFDDMSVVANMSKFSGLEQPYYVRYCWTTKDGLETNTKATKFPISPTPANAGAGGDTVLTEVWETASATGDMDKETGTIAIRPVTWDIDPATGLPMNYRWNGEEETAIAWWPSPDDLGGENG